jgi:ComF family protein
MKATKKFNKFIMPMLDMVFPWKCKICNEKSSAMSICEGCQCYLPWTKNSPVCVVCALPLAGIDGEDLLCGQCIKESPSYDQLKSVFWYEPPINDLIMGYKYFNRWENLQTLMALSAQYFAKEYKNHIVVPVPSYSSRVKQRGFNAVYELMKLLNQYCEFNYDLNLVARIKNTETQTGKSKLQRKRNVRNAFHVNKKTVTKPIILLDEVVTTGATVNEISRELKKAGVKDILVWTLARTRHNT